MSTLADEILASSGGTFDRMSLGSITSMSREIGRAQRFVITPDTMGACWHVQKTKPSSLLAALPLCRVPFDRTWVEWEGQIPGRGQHNGHVAADRNVTPKRFGALLECLDQTQARFGVTFVWSFDWAKLPPEIAASQIMKRTEHAINVCPLGLVVNWHDRWQPRDPRHKIPRAAAHKRLVETGSHFTKFLSDADELSAMEEIGDRTLPTISPHMQPYWRLVEKRNSFLDVERMLKISACDIEGEVLTLQTVLCMLNSRSCVDIVPSELKKLNRARARAGKRPLLDHSVVRIGLSKSQHKQAVEVGASAQEIRQHIVRGHFKLRKSGIYWWRPFIRGCAALGQVERRGYRVDGSRPLSLEAAE